MLMPVTVTVTVTVLRDRARAPFHAVRNGRLNDAQGQGSRVARVPPACPTASQAHKVTCKAPRPADEKAREQGAAGR
jgi:hypothetical protein